MKSFLSACFPFRLKSESSERILIKQFDSV